MAKRHALLIPLLLLNLGCLPGQDSLLPELKGRWSAPNAAKLRSALAAERSATPAAATASGDCQSEYVTFEKRGVTLHMNGRAKPMFMVQDVKRDGSRLILNGSAPLVAGGEKARIELLLRNGEIRLDDILDHSGRSVLYERIDDERARRVGLTTVGAIFRLILDLKPCRA